MHDLGRMTHLTELASLGVYSQVCVRAREKEIKTDDS